MIPALIKFRLPRLIITRALTSPSTNTISTVLTDFALAFNYIDVGDAHDLVPSEPY